MGRLRQRVLLVFWIQRSKPFENMIEERLPYNNHGQILLAKMRSKVEWFYDVVGNLVRNIFQGIKLIRQQVWKHSF